jgi:hypothetical protein
VAPLTLLSSLSGWPEQAGADFLTLGLSFLSACQQLASSFSHFASALPRRAMIRR